jgi:hypothetical protein
MYKQTPKKKKNVLYSLYFIGKSIYKYISFQLEIQYRTGRDVTRPLTLVTESTSRRQVYIANYC